MILPKIDGGNAKLNACIHKGSPKHNIAATNQIDFENLKLHKSKGSYFSQKKNWDLDEAKTVFNSKLINGSNNNRMDCKFDFNFYHEILNKFQKKPNKSKQLKHRKLSMFNNPSKTVENNSFSNSKMTTYQTHNQLNDISDYNKINMTEEIHDEMTGACFSSELINNKEETSKINEKCPMLNNLKIGFTKLINKKLGESKPKKFKKVLKSPQEVNNFLKTLKIPSEFVRYSIYLFSIAHQ